MEQVQIEPEAKGDKAPLPSELSRNALPPFQQDRSFWGLTATQFFGAFNDNLFKQIVLLLFVAVPWPGSREPRDLQWVATFVFSVPFILFSGYAGFLSDRISKRRVIVASKVAEIVIMLLGVGLFVGYLSTGNRMELWLVTAFAVVLFGMGAQSAFFGPGKYGILPEMLRGPDLPGANGLVLMTTFLAIIFGSAMAGLLMWLFPNQLWIAGLACVAIAVIGTATSLLIRRLPAANSQLPFEWSSVAIPGGIRCLLAKDRPLLAAVGASSIFWMTAAIVQMSVNALGDRQLELNKLQTSILVSTVSIGIATGSVIAGRLSHHCFNVRLIHTGVWGMVLALATLALPGWSRPHLLGFWGSIPVLILLGVFTGLFAVPLQVFMQSRPPEGSKGRMIATQNLLNWIGITCSAGIYYLGNRFLRLIESPESGMFAIAAAIMAAVGLFYRPKSETL